MSPGNDLAIRDLWLAQRVRALATEPEFGIWNPHKGENQVNKNALCPPPPHATYTHTILLFKNGELVLHSHIIGHWWAGHLTG